MDHRRAIVAGLVLAGALLVVPLVMVRCPPPPEPPQAAVPIEAVNALEAAEVAATEAEHAAAVGHLNQIVSSSDADARTLAILELRRRRGSAQ